MVESLVDTIIDMLSDDAKEQFRAEYQQLVFRIKDLSKYLKETDWMKNTRAISVVN